MDTPIAEFNADMARKIADMPISPFNTASIISKMVDGILTDVVKYAEKHFYGFDTKVDPAYVFDVKRLLEAKGFTVNVYTDWNYTKRPSGDIHIGWAKEP